MSELGASIGILAYVLKWVPNEDPYRYGQSYIYALGNALPNLGLEIDASNRPKGSLNKKAQRNLSPSTWATYRLNRWAYKTGGGVGFSTIAEAYLNFGFLGVFGYFLGLGFMLGKLDQIDLRAHRNFLIFSGAMLWPLLKTVRNNFSVFIQPFGFIFIILLIWKALTFWKKRKKFG